MQIVEQVVKSVELMWACGAPMSNILIDAEVLYRALVGRDLRGLEAAWIEKLVIETVNRRPVDTSRDSIVTPRD